MLIYSNKISLDCIKSKFVQLPMPASLAENSSMFFSFHAVSVYTFKTHGRGSRMGYS